jgi:[NiFe] hydrogenase diaphorase moiety large subunit
MLEVARNFAHFFAHESCGFCTPCRVGTPLVAGLLDKVAAGHAGQQDLQTLQRLTGVMRGTAHCGLGTSAGNPVVDTLTKFRHVYEARLRVGDASPAFDLDLALARSRELTHRDDAHAHLSTLWP